MQTLPHLVVCEQCDSVYRRRTLVRHEVAHCERCAAVLYRASRLDVDRWLALTVAAAIVFAIANACPVIRISLQGLHSEATLWQSAAALAQGAAAPIAIPAALAIIVVPFLQIALLAWILVFARAGRRAPGFARTMRMLGVLRPWSMVEVGVLGILVAIIKLSSFVQVIPGAGIWATATLMVLVPLIASREIHWLWEWTDSGHASGKMTGECGMSGPPRARQLGIIACHACGLACRVSPGGQKPAPCPRCGAALHRRRPDSLARAWAFLIAGLICYIPANLLPVMYTDLLGSGSDSTIMGGVVEFWKTGSIGIALVIFTASVAVPCTKFLALGLLLVSAQRGSRRGMRERARLYRLVEVVGYWSMLDVLVVAFVCALVRFQALSDIEPRTGILFFGMVVILTMLSAMTFDPRLIWDAEQP
ncbi:PqiA/YebS family transporter subunit [Paraburkholderia sp. USG1]|uniref:paraquat-inducible protein A n=1 Tax=Paraburkholderia sp. USG1 TaxID=2952268 RepID=UPI00285B6F39|nr:PqiA/YebS family transporter subunit [Paraburkholderia sp. USG1]MDR8398355.1 PqiA/YebS family transporter subunit [Paraburkholderia sp. USG1]